jgi:hypothetical protein
MGYQPNHPVIEADPAQVSRSIQRMEAGLGKVWRIADVMEPCRRYEHPFVGSLDIANLVRAGRHRLDMTPAPRQRCGQMGCRQGLG